MKPAPTQVLVIGSGVAGLFYALQCARFAAVTIVTKGSIGESNTLYAQGGIAAVLSRDDSVEEHVTDTLMAGDGLCEVNAVRLMAGRARQAVLTLSALQVQFDRSSAGDFDLHREGGHTHARIVHAADATGMEVETALVSQVRSSPHITILENCFAVDLCVHDNTCTGAIVLESGQQHVRHLEADVVMLATGGAGQLFAKNTNPAVATGDGYAMAYRAGAVLANMEFVQFHPTAFYQPQGDVFLITEALRGLGVELTNKAGQPFMSSYHPLGSLAPRDIVTRAIMRQMQLEGEPCVYLDTTSFDPEVIRQHFPTIWEYCTGQGIDCSKDRIPVAPAAHYMCGGVVTDLKGRTSIHRLYACGEVSCTGVHGANRLASNSLLEGLVFAEQAAADTQLTLPLVNEVPGYAAPLQFTHSDAIPTEQRKKELQQLMWNDAGILRSKPLLNDGQEQLRAWQEELQAQIATCGSTVPALELLNMIETARLIVRGASLREESRGCHYRTDYPEKWADATVIQQVREEELMNAG